MSLLFRVKLPKSFVAVNLSDAFTFQEKEHHHSDTEAAQKILEEPQVNDEGLEIKVLGHTKQAQHPSETVADS